MKRHRGILLAAIVFLTTASASVPEHSEAETVTFAGTVEPAICVAMCGVCCGSHLVTEENNGFTAQVRYGAMLLEPFVDGEKHRFTGYFGTGTGTCGQGSGCTYFFVESVDHPVPAPAELDLGDASLHLPLLKIGDYGYFQVVLAPPYTVTSGGPVAPPVTSVSQSGDCSAPEAVCEQGTFCLSYCGLAGCSITTFHTCEIPCTSSADCPLDQQCATVADGPGQVCVP